MYGCPGQEKTMTDLNRAQQSRGQLLRDALLTFSAVLLAYAAFDDITTDNATTFAFEWLGLSVCAACLLMVSWHLVRSEHRWLGSMSLIVLGVAFVAGSTIRPGISSFRIEYLVTIAGLVWFLGLGGILATRAWRLLQHQAA
jgi:predicted membrane channel-forming protein YqfA (hemolysin III family)